MISVDKGPAPEALVKKGTELVKVHKEEFDRHKDDYLAGKPFDIKDIYKMPIVKKTLSLKQYNKCCFSEAKFIGGDYPHVDHFRPKKRIDILQTGEKLFPGYYWLAYDWENLFLCKELINCSYKKNYFPLVNESERNRNHHDTYIEKNILIDPSKENPRDHIIFVEHEPKPLTIKGRENVELLGLRDSSFTEARRKRFRELKKLKDQVDIAVATGLGLRHSVIEGNIQELKAAIRPTAEFSSMAIDLLQGWPHIQQDL